VEWAVGQRDTAIKPWRHLQQPAVVRDGDQLGRWHARLARGAARCDVRRVRDL
jgi:hypothetical protein